MICSPLLHSCSTSNYCSRGELPRLDRCLHWTIWVFLTSIEAVLPSYGHFCVFLLAWQQESRRKADYFYLPIYVWKWVLGINDLISLLKKNVYRHIWTHWEKLLYAYFIHICWNMWMIIQVFMSYTCAKVKQPWPIIHVISTIGPLKLPWLDFFAHIKKSICSYFFNVFRY